MGHVRWMGLFALIGCLVPAMGCGPSEDAWAQRSAKLSCKLAKRCSTSQFYFNYDNVEECVDDALEQNEDRQDFYDDECVFNKKEARECYAAMKNSCKNIGKDYEQLYDACSRVWNCGPYTFDTASGEGVLVDDTGS